MEMGKEESLTPDLSVEHVPGWTKPPDLDEIAVAGSAPPHLSKPAESDARQGYD